MLIEPGIEVNAVIQEAPAQPYRSNREAGEQRNADPKVGRCLLS
jgi:hypothetical protein